MKIGIDHLNYDELVELNHKIVERLKFLDSMHAHKAMMQFNLGDEVCFEPSGRGKQFGKLVKYNRKTVTVITESGQKWNVSPHLLSKVKTVNRVKGIGGRHGDSGYRRHPDANSEGYRIDPVGIDSHQGAGFHVLGSGPHGCSYKGLFKKE